MKAHQGLLLLRFSTAFSTKTERHSSSGQSGILPSQRTRSEIFAIAGAIPRDTLTLNEFLVRLLR